MTISVQVDLSIQHLHSTPKRRYGKPWREVQGARHQARERLQLPRGGPLRPAGGPADRARRDQQRRRVLCTIISHVKRGVLIGFNIGPGKDIRLSGLCHPYGPWRAVGFSSKICPSRIFQGLISWEVQIFQGMLCFRDKSLAGGCAKLQVLSMEAGPADVWEGLAELRRPLWCLLPPLQGPD